MSKAATGLWGVFASIVAVWAAELGSLDRGGESLRIVFLRIDSRGVHSCRGVPARYVERRVRRAHRGMASVAWAATFVAFLWHNVIGALVVVLVGLVVSSVTQKAKGAEKRVRS